MHIRGIRYASMAFGLGVLSACAADHEPTDPSSIDQAIGALASEVAACGEQRDRCELGGQDASIDLSCADAFRACKDEALGRALPDLEKGVSACAATSRDCRKGATTADEKKLCREQLESCVAESRPDESDEAGDAGSDEEHASPVSSCTTALRSCIEGDDQAKVCTEQLRTCLADTLPQHGKGRANRPDGGADQANSGKADRERGKPDGGQTDDSTDTDEEGEESPDDESDDRSGKPDAGRMQ